MITVSPWAEPAPVGIAPALDSTFTVAAPLLAGFAATIVATVSTDPGARLAGYTVLTAAVMAVGLLVLGLEVGLQARSEWATPAEYLDWHPLARKFDAALDEIRIQQRANYHRWLWYQARARRLYNWGLIAFLATVALLVIPADIPRAIPDVEFLHFAPLVVALLLLFVEAWWMACSRRPSLPGTRFFVAPNQPLTIPPAPAGFDRDALQ